VLWDGGLSLGGGLHKGPCRRSASGGGPRLSGRPLPPCRSALPLLRPQPTKPPPLPHQVIHADLKARNVLLKSDGSQGRGLVAKVADFGLSVRMDQQATHVSEFQVRQGQAAGQGRHQARNRSAPRLAGGGALLQTRPGRGSCAHAPERRGPWTASPPLRR
jgi:serine/threonine protein kinase